MSCQPVINWFLENAMSDRRGPRLPRCPYAAGEILVAGTRRSIIQEGTGHARVLRRRDVWGSSSPIFYKYMSFLPL
jgi:hypothetical protein